MMLPFGVSLFFYEEKQEDEAVLPDSFSAVYCEHHCFLFSRWVRRSFVVAYRSMADEFQEVLLLGRGGVLALVIMNLPIQTFRDAD